MKKYLIKGAWALLAGTLAVGCAEKESEYVPIAQQKVKAFEDVFKEVYGDNIDPYQDWGFNGGKTNLDPKDESIYVDVVDADGDVAFTRAAAFGRTSAVLAFESHTRTAGAYPNANMWAEYFRVPPELTDAQKDLVRRYFQQNPNQKYEDPRLTQYFVQQVYKGATNTTGSQSAEKYTSANGGVVTGSDHMDHLCAVYNNGNQDHIFNFNSGTCFPNYNVQNSEGVEYHSQGGTADQHTDGIQLMTSSTTENFGYFNSDGSLGHTDYTSLVSWETISKWAGIYGTENDILNDGWNRSFMGFDFEQIVGDDILVKSGSSYVYAKFGDAPDKDYLKDGNNVLKMSEVADNLLTDENGNTLYVKFLINETNMYCGDNGDIDGNDLITTVTQPHPETGHDQDYDAIDLAVIRGKIAAGYLPVYGSNFTKWVKVHGGADGYYSDWIVSLTEALGAEFEDYLETEEEKWCLYKEGRVFCEDLGRATREDLDYNDVVFDVKIYQRDYYYEKKLVKYSDRAKTKMIGQPQTVGIPRTEGPDYYAQVTLRAAGGTIPVVIKAGGNDYAVHAQFNDPEPTSIETMVNTRDNNSVAYGSFASRTPVDLIGQDVLKRTFKMTDNVVEEAETKITLNLIPGIHEISDIGIWSAFGGEAGSNVQELSSKIGEAPQKFMAPIGTPWTSERKNISLAYPGFNAWVENEKLEPWDSPNTDYTYSVERPYAADGQQVPRAMRVKRTHSVEGETIVWEPTEAEKAEQKNVFGANDTWTLKNLDNIDLSNVGQFFAGDRIRFYAEGMPIPKDENGNLKEFTDDIEKAWITVVIGSIRPYFVDQEFPNYDFENGVKVFKSDGCLEVLIDEKSADLLNAEFEKGNKTMQIQGRNFTLTKICVIPFN